jgi:hypothetical protein
VQAWWNAKEIGICPVLKGSVQIVAKSQVETLLFLFIGKTYVLQVKIASDINKAVRSIWLLYSEVLNIGG